MNAVGDDLGATVGNVINCSYKLMVATMPDALLILGDTNSCLSAIAAETITYSNISHGGGKSLQGRVLAGGNEPSDSGYYI